MASNPEFDAEYQKEMKRLRREAEQRSRIKQNERERRQKQRLQKKAQKAARRDSGEVGFFDVRKKDVIWLVSAIALMSLMFVGWVIYHLASNPDTDGGTLIVLIFSPIILPIIWIFQALFFPIQIDGASPLTVGWSLVNCVFAGWACVQLIKFVRVKTGRTPWPERKKSESSELKELLKWIPILLGCMTAVLVLILYLTDNMGLIF